MSAQLKATLKGYFNTGDKPTEANFTDLVDTIPARAAGYVVAANNAPAAVKAQADYVCDNTADDVEIQAAIDALGAAGGTVILSTGTFTLAAPITVNAGISLISQNKATTILTAGAAYNNNFIILLSSGRLENLFFTIPASCLTDVITSSNRSYCVLKHLRFSGGDSTTPYCIVLADFFNVVVEDIIMSVAINGIKLANVDGTYHYGNSIVSMIAYAGSKAGCIGLNILGGSKMVNLIAFSGINILFHAGFEAGSICLAIQNCGYNTFSMLDCEGGDAGSVVITGNVGAGAHSNGNVFAGMYLGTDVTIGANCDYNTFVGGKIFGTLTDGGTGNEFLGTVHT